jgi:hypothetical protein
MDKNNNENKNLARYGDLSVKFFQMGQSLILEGQEKEDFTITSLGNFLVFMAGIILDEDDVDYMSNMFAMFSAKKLLDEYAETDLDFEQIVILAKQLKNKK